MESKGCDNPLRNELRTILQGVEQGDPVAIAEYVYYWQPYLLRVIRRRHRKGLALSDSDSMDVFQSAFRELLAGLQDKRFHPRHPESCIGIMLGHAQKKISRAASRQRTRCRHCESVARHLTQCGEARDEAAQPFVVLEQQDEVCYFLKGLSREDCFLLRAMAEGDSWAKIGDSLGMSAEATRKRYGRQEVVIVQRLDKLSNAPECPLIVSP